MKSQQHIYKDDLYTKIILDLREDLIIVLLLFYLGFYVAFNTVQVISRRVVGRAEETSTYSLFTVAPHCSFEVQQTRLNIFVFQDRKKTFM